MIMKYLKLFPLLLIIFLSACNLPIAEKTPTPDLVATIVGMTMTERSRGTETAMAYTATVTMTSTEPAASETPVPETPTQTATLAANFRDTLGAPAWKDTLDDGRNFGLDQSGYQDDYTKINIQNGAMVISNTSQSGYYGWRLTTKSPQDFYLEADIGIQNCAGTDLYGLVIRAPDYGSGFGYYLGLNCSGQYQITRWDANGIARISNLSLDPAVKPGSNQTNVLGVLARGSQLTLFVNGSQIIEVTDSTFSGSGHFGVFIAGQSLGEFLIRVEEMAYWTLP